MINLNDRKCEINNDVILKELNSLNLMPQKKDGLFGYENFEVEFAIKRILNRYQEDRPFTKENESDFQVHRDRAYSKEETAEILKISTSTLDRKRRAGVIGKTTKSNSGNKVLIPGSEILKYLSQYRNV